MRRSRGIIRGARHCLGREGWISDLLIRGLESKRCAVFEVGNGEPENARATMIN